MTGDTDIACRSDRTAPAWQRAFPDADHKWTMGLRQIDAAQFLVPWDSSGTVLAERSRWLTDEPRTYAALTPAAEPALRETVALAQSLGATIDPSPASWDELLSLGQTWEADFVWMQPDQSGVQRLTGGVVCFPSSWDLHEKLGHSMREIHGPVPGLNESLGRQIDTFLSKMMPGVAWGRENAGYCRVPELNQHPARVLPLLDSTTSASEIWIRVEHQLLLKLPLSQSILFAIRVELIPLLRVLAEPETAARLARQLETISSAAAKYKNISGAQDLIMQWIRSTGSTR